MTNIDPAKLLTNMSMDNDKRESPVGWLSDKHRPGKAPVAAPRSAIGKAKPTGDEIYKYPLVALNMHNIVTDIQDPGYPPIDQFLCECPVGVGLGRREGARIVKVFKGRDGREYIQSDLTDKTETTWGSNPLFADNPADIERYARDILSKFKMPTPGWGHIWENAQGDICWRRLRVKTDLPLPEDIDPRANTLEDLSGEVAEKFIHQWPKTRTAREGLPESFEAVYAFQWLCAFENAQNQTIVFEKTQSELADETGMPDYDWGLANDDSPGPDHMYIAGVKAGQKLGEILYEWRLCVVHGSAVFKALADLETRRAVAAATAAFRILWHVEGFKFACEERAAKPNISTNKLAEVVEGKLKAHRIEKVSGLKPEAAKAEYPEIPSRETIGNAIRDWENHGFKKDGMLIGYVPKKE